MTQLDFRQGITFNQDITDITIRLLDEDGSPLDLSGGDWYFILEQE